MFTVELNEKLSALELHFDKAGIESLIRQLENLKAVNSHIHLMTPAWGGKELTENTHGANKLINHLILYSHQT
jgi:immunity protein 32 of polymorphic toxin system